MQCCHSAVHFFFFFLLLQANIFKIICLLFYQPAPSTCVFISCVHLAAELIMFWTGKVDELSPVRQKSKHGVTAELMLHASKCVLLDLAY